MSRKTEVKTQSRHRYPVIINSGWPGFSSFTPVDKLLVVIDENVNQIYGDELRGRFNELTGELLWYQVPSGESSKSIDEFNRIADYALANKVRRQTPLWAVGGGVTGDLAGFAAASLLRGLPLYHLPTTLLAMVDSAIGGKTGINHRRGKNLIGAFYQPELVWANVDVLKTLPEREWNCGLAEVLKYACISDFDIFSKVESILKSDNENNQKELISLIEKSAQIKVEIVNEDEREAGKRAFLNFGHTFGHAIETFTEYRRFVHGEAIFIGLVAAAWLSEKLGSPVTPEPLLNFTNQYRLSTLDLCTSVNKMVSLMESDKKNITSTVRIIVLNDWGQPEIKQIEDHSLLESAFQFALRSVHYTE